MSIEDIYKKLSLSLDETLEKKRSNHFIKSNISTGSCESLLDSILEPNSIRSQSQDVSQDVFGVKELVRNKFGKHGKVQKTFGCHPDFIQIDGTGELRPGYAVTLFMDIIGSTKLGVTYTPEEVFYIKNDIIRCAIETIVAFDGHVHRIMGDAVMAFFRSEQKKNDGLIMDSGIDALNCSVFLIEMIEKVVTPKLSKMGAEKIGIRIGIDYGKDEEVIWGTYGYIGSHEVTATSYHVDVAAKLQQKAPKNSILIGANFADLLGLDDEFLGVLMKEKSGSKEPQTYVKPNYLTNDGTPKNYKQFLIAHQKYKSLTPINSYPLNLTLTATLKNTANAPSEDYYDRCSRSIKKGSGIDFKAVYLGVENRNLQFLFRVENTGIEAKKTKDNGNHQTYVPAKARDGGTYFAKHWEQTSYKGIHHMFISVWCGNTQITPEERFTIFITD